MGQRITICHFTEGGTWDTIEIATEGLNGHDNHDFDIWPAVPEVTEGKNWPLGEDVYINGCVLEATVEPTPSASPSPTPTLPGTGADAMSATLLAVSMLAAGAAMVWRKNKRRPRDP